MELSQSSDFQSLIARLLVQRSARQAKSALTTSLPPSTRFRSSGSCHFSLVSSPFSSQYFTAGSLSLSLKHWSLVERLLFEKTNRNYSARGPSDSGSELFSSITSYHSCRHLFPSLSQQNLANSKSFWRVSTSVPNILFRIIFILVSLPGKLLTLHLFESFLDAFRRGSP